MHNTNSLFSPYTLPRYFQHCFKEPTNCASKLSALLSSVRLQDFSVTCSALLLHYITKLGFFFNCIRLINQWKLNKIPKNCVKALFNPPYTIQNTLSYITAMNLLHFNKQRYPRNLSSTGIHIHRCSKILRITPVFWII